jgi:2-dehydropantoate 2-reductase
VKKGDRMQFSIVTMDAGDRQVSHRVDVKGTLPNSEHGPHLSPRAPGRPQCGGAPASTARSGGVDRRKGNGHDSHQSKFEGGNPNRGFFMNIAVIGAGAMGSLFGALLAEAGQPVTLVDLQRDHVDRVNARGLTIESGTSSRTVRVPATVDPAGLDPADLCIVFVKSNHTADAARTAVGLCGPSSMVLTLQNGMGNAEILAEILGPSRVIAGTTSHGATFLKPGRIRHAGAGETVIGPWLKARHTDVETLSDFFNQAGIATHTDSDIRSVMWAKLLINVGINAITALTGISNGQLLDLEPTRRLSAEAVREAAAVAKALSIAIEGDPVEKVFSVAEATAANRSSMGQDVDNARMTEIAAINGFVVRQADKAGLPAPVNRTLTALVETLQNHF